MDLDTGEYPPIKDFTENCTLAIGQVVQLLIEGLKNIFMDCKDICEHVNFEYITLIESEYSQLVEEIKNGVQLYVDCNSAAFQSFAAADLSVALLRYNEQIYRAREILNTPEKELKYVDRIKKLKLEGGGDTLKDAANSMIDDELHSKDDGHELMPEGALPPGDGFEEETADSLSLLDVAEVTFDSVYVQQGDEGDSVTPIKSEHAQEGVSGRCASPAHDEREAPRGEEATTPAETVESAGDKEQDEDESETCVVSPSPRDVIDGDVKGVHPCSKCSKKFNTSRNLKLHMATHNNLRKDFLSNKRKCKVKMPVVCFTCSHCDKRFRSRARFDDHVAMHTKPYICPICGVAFGKEQVLRAHQNIHSGEAPFECEICHKGYRERYLLADHMRYHRTKVSCPHCPVTFSKKSNLYRHIEMKHEAVQDQGEKKHMCSLCEIGFSYVESYESHMRKTHPESVESQRPKFKCNTCGVRFKSQEARETHKLRCIEQTYKCDICSKTFSNKILLHNHKRYHASKDLFCPHCGKRFVKSYDLKSHVMRLHDNDRPFKCEYCFKGFVTNHELKKHVVTHTGVSPFQCHLCHKYFICNQVLQRHVNEVHMRIAKFVCDLCGERFRDARTLRNHISRHDDNKPFKCPTCNKGFSWTAGLKRHIDYVHGNKSSARPKKARKVPKLQPDQVESEVVPVLKPSNNQFVLYQPGVKEDLSAHEVSAAERVEIQSVVYVSEQAGGETLFYGAGPAPENGVIYCHNTQGHVPPVGEDCGAGGDSEIQLIMYST